MGDLVQRLLDEADLCRNETATDIAELLEEAAEALRIMPPEEATLPMLQAYSRVWLLGSELDGATVWRAMLLASRVTPPR